MSSVFLTSTTKPQTMTNIDLVDEIIRKFAQEQKEVFFRESDIVWTLQMQLMKALRNSDYKVFHEYPVEPLVPLKMSKGKMNELIEDFGQPAWLANSYANEGSAYCLKEHSDEILKELSVKFYELRRKGVRFEAIYTDLAIVKPAAGKTDLETKPEIIIEVKYEPDIINRKGKDFRNNRSERINSQKDIENDIRSLERCLEHPEIKHGVFVFVDEGDMFRDFLQKSEMHDFGNRVWVYKKAQRQYLSL